MPDVRAYAEYLESSTKVRALPDGGLCITCGVTKTAMWWKCCAEHVTQYGPDVVCNLCCVMLHAPTMTYIPEGWEEKVKEELHASLLRARKRMDEEYRRNTKRSSRF